MDDKAVPVRTFYVNQEIKGQKFYDRDRRMTKRMLVSIGVLA